MCEKENIILEKNQWCLLHFEKKGLQMNNRIQFIISKPILPKHNVVVVVVGKLFEQILKKVFCLCVCEKKSEKDQNWKENAKNPFI